MEVSLSNWKETDHMTSRMLKIDPEFADLIPPLTKDEHESLESSLLADGCIDTLVVWHDTLIDGHNRYEICRKHAIEFGVTNLNLPTRDDAIMWIVLHQLGRRNLSDFARVELALRIKPIVEAKANEREKKGASAIAGSQKSDEGRTDEIIANSAHVSRDTVRKVETIKKNGTPALIAAVKAEEISINKAAKVAKQPKDKQAKAMKEKAPKKAKAAKSDGTDWKAKYEALVKDYDELKENRDDLADELKACEAVRTDTAVIEMKKLQAEVKHCTRRRDELMASAHEMRKECTRWQTRAKQAGWRPNK